MTHVTSQFRGADIQTEVTAFQQVRLDRTTGEFYLGFDAVRLRSPVLEASPGAGVHVAVIEGSGSVQAARGRAFEPCTFELIVNCGIEPPTLVLTFACVGRPPRRVMATITHETQGAVLECAGYGPAVEGGPLAKSRSGRS